MPEPDFPFVVGDGSRSVVGPTMVFVGDGRSRIRRVVRTTTRHVTVVSYTSNSSQSSRTHTSHHVTTVSFPQKVADRQSPAYAVQGNTGGYVYLQQQHYAPPQQVVYQHQICPAQQVIHSGHQNVQTTLHKKGSVRNGGDVLKRTRTQNAYELSQDLLEKQIELLERKYGGVRARNAAITIQRAFRHYTMVKKFASITAMAKAEKRLSRRVPGQSPSSFTDENGQLITSTYVDSDAPVNSGGVTVNMQQQQMQQGQHSQAQRVCATITASPTSQQAQQCRVAPTRSMSLRERRSLDASPIPRSQSGTTSPMPATCWAQAQHQAHTHPHVNVLHAEQHYYSTPAAVQYHQPMGIPSQYRQDEMSFNSSGHLDASSHSMNVSWNSHQSPHTPYYTAAQIYSRPRGTNSSASAAAAAAAAAAAKRTPPEVPKRTSSITSGGTPRGADLMQPRALRPNGLCKTAENGSLSSVQSSGSDSSASTERMQCEIGSDRSNSPQWKRKPTEQRGVPMAQSPDLAGSVTGSAESECLSSHTSAAQYALEQHEQIATPTSYKVSETIRKRQYRIGLNLFNKKPEKGVTYLIRRGFLENTPQGVARFLISRKGLSRQMIGEYLGNLQNPFNMAVLECFAGELDLCGMQVDVALRKFQAYFRMPGEAQKIERLMEVFSQRYCQCNSDIVARLRSSDTVFVLAFAIIMLNTDLHTPNLKPERRMRVEDFIKNLRGIDDCHDIDTDMLCGIYERIKANEFKPGSDHVTQVMKVQATIVGKKPNLALPHRRLVCYCRLYEIPDINKKERAGVHQREVFLFNDLLVITKILSKKKSSVTYTFRNSYPLCGMVVTLLDVPNYPYCIRLSQKVDGKVLITFNARNEHDRCKFAEDLRESICEMDEMEALRIEAELERQKSGRGGNRSGNAENRDSGVADVEVCPCPYQTSPSETTQHDAQLKRSALSNSLLDMHEQFGNEKPQRRGSVGSLDSGMSISFQSTSASSGSRSDSKVRLMHPGTASGTPQANTTPLHHPQPGFLGGIFHKRERKPSRSEDAGSAFGRSTEV
ncbi:IQ motif and SEC7 domain-containing protein 1 isoform X1 [Phlebotomus papatasi]|uniref:IQ motif and SEC7 domain-containing protein 1 isoform X1 n=1 Tax=Phlebotomus papatasi TaxID=29031 RepID=UPI002483505B|nr:IQ motif and SEC7 domain-containing protein 1 isoform X1 [Phlebotomus papatasi]XP_055704901.1 IQ motif and SEC7 domain-containing protein 1 isoform X1 [Phlebotomus papatasi]XP_055704902.1 IQ motif and SEC7 domain-containing protein 1 isoform X1 [Phlebotomus papatasi]